MARLKRRLLLVDANVQGALVVRVVTYWMYCLVTVAFMMTCWTILSARPASSWELMAQVGTQCGPAFVASLLLLPLVIVDCVRVTNRFVGPLNRVRKAMRDLAAGNDVPNLAFRRGDLLCDLADDFNRLNDHFKKVQSQGAAADESEAFKLHAG